MTNTEIIKQLFPIKGPDAGGWGRCNEHFNEHEVRTLMNFVEKETVKNLIEWLLTSKFSMTNGTLSHPGRETEFYKTWMMDDVRPSQALHTELLHKVIVNQFLENQREISNECRA